MIALEAVKRIMYLKYQQIVDIVYIV
ncbi:hypothetical protein MPC1_2260006 [Methylocella tundrae]|nr:hypothetical protein MPC1_2260006 [Methylocella tundrae]